MWIGLLVMGALAGVAAGMFGIGGGVIIVPSLVLLGFTLAEANGTSLAALLLPVGAFGVMSYHHNHLIRWRTSMIIAAGLLVGGVGGGWAANRLDALNPAALNGLYGVFLFYVGWRMAAPLQLFGLRQALDVPTDAPLRDGILPVTLLGLLAGLASGMFGIGGGAVIVPILVTFMNFPQKMAVATSLGALLPPVGAGAAWVYFQNGNLVVSSALPVALGLLFGAWFGARITIGLPAATVKRLYGVFLLLISLNFMWEGIVGVFG